MISYALSLILLLQVSRMPRSEKATPPSIGALFEGVKYASSRQDLMGTYLIDLAAMFFAMPTALFPFWADQLNSPQSLGFLYSAGTVVNRGISGSWQASNIWSTSDSAGGRRVTRPYCNVGISLGHQIMAQLCRTGAIACAINSKYIVFLNLESLHEECEKVQIFLKS